jgi:hypothetical protein
MEEGVMLDETQSEGEFATIVYRGRSVPAPPADAVLERVHDHLEELKRAHREEADRIDRSIPPALYGS